jgi:hypothetical protein
MSETTGTITTSSAGCSFPLCFLKRFFATTFLSAHVPQDLDELDSELDHERQAGPRARQYQTRARTTDKLEHELDHEPGRPVHELDHEPDSPNHELDSPPGLDNTTGNVEHAASQTQARLLYVKEKERPLG